MENTNKVTQEELAKIQEISSKFNQGKIALGECELQKQEILRVFEELKLEYISQEKVLSEKYGSDVLINIKTGEITKND